MGVSLFNYLCDFPFAITMVCRTPDSAEKISKSYNRKLNRALKHGLIDQEGFDRKFNNIRISNEINDLAGCDIVIESITENTKMKIDLVKKLDDILNPECIIASNSSSISPRELITGKNRKGKTIGLHFFFPVSIVNLVEVNIPDNTLKSTIRYIEGFLKEINKKYIVLPEESHFLVNRIFLPLQNGCCFLHQEYGLSYEVIDFMIQQYLFPIGVFEFFDHVGIDTVLNSVLNYTRDATNREKFHPLINELKLQVKLGNLGRKNKKGFYNYDVGKQSEKVAVGIDIQENVQDKFLEMIYGWYLKPLFELLSTKVYTQEMIEFIVRESMNPYKSPFQLAGEINYPN